MMAVFLPLVWLILLRMPCCWFLHIGFYLFLEVYTVSSVSSARAATHNGCLKAHTRTGLSV